MSDELQSEQIEKLYADAVEATHNITRANVQLDKAIRTNRWAQGRAGCAGQGRPGRLGSCAVAMLRAAWQMQQLIAAVFMAASGCCRCMLPLRVPPLLPLLQLSGCCVCPAQPRMSHAKLLRPASAGLPAST